MGTKLKINLYSKWYKLVAVGLIVVCMVAITTNIANPETIDNLQIFVEGEEYYRDLARNENYEIEDRVLNVYFENQGGTTLTEYEKQKSVGDINEYLGKGYRYLVIKDGKILKTDEKEPKINDVSIIDKWDKDGYLSYNSRNYEVGNLEDDNYEYEEIEVYTFMPQAEFDKLKADNKGNLRDGRFAFYSFIFGSIGILLGAIWIMVFAGQNQKGDEVKLYWFDHIYVDVLLIITTILEVAAGAGFVVVHEALRRGYGNSEVILTSLVLISVLFVIYNLYFVSNIGKRIKRREFFRYSMIYKFFRWVGNIFRSIFSPLKKKFTESKSKLSLLWGEKLTKRIIVWVSIFVFAVFANILLSAAFGPLWAILTYCALIYFMLKPVFKEIDEFRVMAKGVKDIRNGDLSHKIPFASCRELSVVIDDINNIADGFESAVQKAVKAEKMRTELITNVSHDLKTPLTSIIGYVDLLEGVEELPDEARDYVSVIKTKSARLKHIISDLFDLSKSSSGNVELEMENLDLKKLLEQTMADMEDVIKSSDRVIKQDLPLKPVMIYADGKKMYRVFQNIIDNALKYSLENTRIFVNLKKENQKAIVEIKNIASYEMDFEEDEIIERFTRGDKNRATEGSGLGLSIARSFTEACGGSMKLVVDGDQFKVIIEFNILNTD